MTWQTDHIEAAERMIAFAKGSMTTDAVDMGELPLEALGERPVLEVYSDRHRRYEEDFNALVALEVQRGRVSADVGLRAVANFHDFARASQLTSLQNQPGPQASPRFYQ